MPELEVSIVVPAHDAAATLGAQLDALLAQTYPQPYEIVVVDNRSTDQTAALISARASADSRVRLVSAATGSGPSYARNVGVAAARAETIVCCDADDVVTPGWLAAMAGALGDHEYVGGPLEVDSLNERWVADGRGRWGALGPGRFAGIEFAHGCNFGIRKSRYLAVGGLDEAMRAGEEVDLALRLAAAGVVLHYVAEAVVGYRFRTELRATWRQALAQGRVARTLERRATVLLDATTESTTTRRVTWLVTHVYRLGSRAGRIRWVWIAGNVAGRITPAASGTPEETRRGP